MTNIPAEAIHAVFDHSWADWPRSAHSQHTYDYSCAVCRGNVPEILAVAAPVLGEYIAALLDVHSQRLQESARRAARDGHPDQADRHAQRAAAFTEAAQSARAVFATGGDDESAAIAEQLAKAQAGADFIQDHVTLERSLIECILLEHAEELDDEQGRVDANLAELAYIYRQATGWDAKAELARDLLTQEAPGTPD